MYFLDIKTKQHLRFFGNNGKEMLTSEDIALVMA